MRMSALIVEVPWSEPVVGPWRVDHDPVSHRGVPAHLTILFPFRPPESIDGPVEEALATIAASVPAHEVSLVDVHSFPDAVWLRPDPIVDIDALSGGVWAAFPDCPPHGGRWVPPLPLHVTLGQGDDPVATTALRDAIAGRLEGALPISGPLEGLSLFVSDEAGEWSRRTMFPFGATRGSGV